MKRQVQVFSELHRVMNLRRGAWGIAIITARQSLTLPLAKLRETDSGRNSAEVIKKKDPDKAGCGYGH